MRYLLSRLVPIPMHSTYAAGVGGTEVVAGVPQNHFRNDDHYDLVSIRWWQWRERCFGRRTVTTCIGA